MKDELDVGAGVEDGGSSVFVAVLFASIPLVSIEVVAVAAGVVIAFVCRGITCA